MLFFNANFFSEVLKELAILDASFGTCGMKYFRFENRINGFFEALAIGIKCELRLTFVSKDELHAISIKADSI